LTQKLHLSTNAFITNDIYKSSGTSASVWEINAKIYILNEQETSVYSVQARRDERYDLANKTRISNISLEP
jgi:hypothetical protein